MPSRPPATPEGDPGASVGRPPATTARLLRERAATGPLWIPVDGTSMGRTVPGGSRVHVVPAPAPRRGEVWAFCTAQGELFVHRYRGPVGDHHRFQGDARIRADDPVPADLLVGRVVELAGGRRPRGAWFGALQRWPRQARAAFSRRRRGTHRSGVAIPAPVGVLPPPGPTPPDTRSAPRP